MARLDLHYASDNHWTSRETGRTIMRTFSTGPMLPTKVRTPVEFWNSSKAIVCAALAVEAVVLLVLTDAPPLLLIVLAPSLSPPFELEEAMR